MKIITPLRGLVVAEVLQQMSGAMGHSDLRSLGVFIGTSRDEVDALIRAELNLPPDADLQAWCSSQWGYLNYYTPNLFIRGDHVVLKSDPARQTWIVLNILNGQLFLDHAPDNESLILQQWVNIDECELAN